jgi:peptide/nickel transport system substrate-binding protein
VVVRTWEEFAPQARHVASLLRDLGYRARVGSVSSREWFAAAYPPEGEAFVQVGLSGWIVDYLGPSTFFDQLRCGASDPARFCNPGIDRQMDRALAVQASDPDAADRLWARIDRLLTDQAAWIAYATPRRVAFTSDRVGNYQFHPVWHALLDQMWVR